MSRFAAELVTAGGTGLVGFVTVLGALEYGIGWDVSGPQPGAFPFYVGLIIMAASAGTAAQVSLRRERLTATFLDRHRLKRVLGFVGMIAAFVLVAAYLGLYVASIAYLFISMTRQGGYRWWIAATVSVGVAVFFYLLLEVAFQVPLLKGPLEAALGIY